MKTMAQSSVVSSSSLGEIKMNETKFLSFAQTEIESVIFLPWPPGTRKSNSEKRDVTRRVENLTTKLKT